MEAGSGREAGHYLVGEIGSEEGEAEEGHYDLKGGWRIGRTTNLNEADGYRKSSCHFHWFRIHRVWLQHTSFTLQILMHPLFGWHTIRRSILVSFSTASPVISPTTAKEPMELWREVPKSM